MRRRFNSRERLALFRGAGGRCQRCGVELDVGWHADHIHPYSEGGPTEVINGAALCPPCNITKGSHIMKAPDRDWQQRFLAKFADGGERHFLLVACPGAGKTLASVAAAHPYPRVAVVVPSIDVKRGWIREFSRNAGRTSHDLTKDGMPIARHAEVVVITYGGLPRYTVELAGWLQEGSGLLVLDEIHHGGESDRDGLTKWAKAVTEVAAGASRSLLLTGTPLRTGADRIPFVRYDVNDEPIADFRYGFAEAWAADPSPIRRARFLGHDAEVEWLRTEGEGSAELAKMTLADDEVAALRSAIDPGGSLVEDVLTDIRQEMDERRRVRPRAAALIACRDQPHARLIAQRMHDLGMHDLVLALSDDEGSSDVIGRFRDGDTAYIVAVRMLSEGVDVQRLEVLAHFTPTRSRLFVHQLTGRVLRQIPGEEHVEAVIHYPMSPTLRDEFAKIEEALTYQVKVPGDDVTGGPPPPSTFIFGTATSAEQVEVAGSGHTIDRGRIDALRVGVPSLGEDQAIEVARFLQEDGRLQFIDPIPRTRVVLDPQAEVENLRAERDRAAKSLAGAMASVGLGPYPDCIRKVNGDLLRGWHNDPARLSPDELRAQLRQIKEWRNELG